MVARVNFASFMTTKHIRAKTKTKKNKKNEWKSVGTLSNLLKLCDFNPYDSHPHPFA